MIEFGSNNNEITESTRNAPFLISIIDNPDNELVVKIAFPQKGEKDEDLDMSIHPKGNSEKLKDILSESYPIYPNMKEIYEIRFDSYIIYQCRNESYTSLDNSEIRKGNYLIIFEKSKLLDYYENVIFDFDYNEWKSKRKHYGIYTENHIIDIIANRPPTITKINSDLLNS